MYIMALFQNTVEIEESPTFYFSLLQGIGDMAPINTKIVPVSKFFSDVHSGNFRWYFQDRKYVKLPSTERDVPQFLTDRFYPLWTSFLEL